MKQAELQAKVAAGALAGIAILLLIAAYMYGATAFWAGGLAALAQAFLCGLAAWGLTLSRQQKELTTDLNVTPQISVSGDKSAIVGGSLSSFRMSQGDDELVTARPRRSAARAQAVEQRHEVRTLETGFQRVVVGLSGAGFLILAAIISYLIRSDFSQTQLGEKVLAARRDVSLDNLAVVLAVGALLAYWGTFYYARARRELEGLGDAVGGIMIMGLPGMIAVAAGLMAGWLNVQYAVQLAAAVVVVLLFVQGLELLFNAFRSYAGIEEFDQAPVDLQQLPLVPMLTSLWVFGLKSLLAQSVGLSGGAATKDEDGTPGLFAQMMPRVLVAIVVLAVLASMLRVVQPGEVAIRERLGWATDEDINHPLQPGLHITWPWPLDELVHIPTQRVQEVNVGTEEPPEVVNGKKLDFKFWTWRHTAEGAAEEEYITSELPSMIGSQPRSLLQLVPGNPTDVVLANNSTLPSHQLLGTYVSVLWRVTDPSAFYRHISHNDFLDQITAPGEAGGTTSQTVARKIYEALIQQLASRAVTQTFARHTLADIMGGGRWHVETACRERLQTSLNRLDSGIEILVLTIKDVHPPIGVGRQQTATGMVLGPADAYEDVVSAREQRETMIDMELGNRYQLVKQSEGKAHQIHFEAQAYQQKRIAEAMGETQRRLAMSMEYAAHPNVAQHWFKTNALEEVLPGVRKIVLAPGVTSPDLWQLNKAGDAMFGGSMGGGPTGPPPGAGPPGGPGGGGQR